MMNKIQKLAYKKMLFDNSVELLKQRIALSEALIKEAQLTANEEEKSSAGDKYETSRAMSHIQKEMYSKQLSANQNELVSLLTIDHTTLHTSIIPGTVIKCSDYTFFIAAGLGKLVQECETIFLISPLAPLSLVLSAKNVNDSFKFNNTDIIIKDLF